MRRNSWEEFENQLAVEKVKTELERPRRYKVILVNDDYTPMEFVVLVLREMFFMDEERAVKIMLQVHNLGKGVCGVFTRDVAETKVSQVNTFSRQNNHPLLCDMEPEELH